MMILEICATSVQSALNAQAAGAQRIELCAELAVGGITPSYGLISAVRRALAIPVFVLIRPRSGNFVYTDFEFDVMLSDIAQCKALGCDGIVAGVLTPDNEVDISRTHRLIEVTKPLSFTFHRAFDCTEDAAASLEQIIESGAARILTSGQGQSAEVGFDLLCQLHQKAKGRIIVMPGGGINAQNAIKFKQAGFDEMHASASGVISSSPRPKVGMNSEKHFQETELYASDPVKIAELIAAISDEL